MPLGFSRSIFSKQAVAAGGRSTVVTVGNNTQVDTARSKFGGASALFDGTNDAIRFTPDSSVMPANYTGSFTFEFFMNYDIALSTTLATVICTNRFGGGFGAKEFMILADGNNGIRFAYNAYNGSDPIQNVNLTGSGIPAADTWHHYAVGYDGTTWAQWLNGTRTSTATATYSLTELNTNGFQLGGYGSVTNPGNDYNTGGGGSDGWIDEFRVSLTDRYGVGNSSITVPTSAFTNDADTVMLFHMDGTDGSQTFEDDDA